jgi:fido (protein-threonine AMPylation protein)
MQVILADESQTAGLLSALTFLESVPVGGLDLSRLVSAHRVLLSTIHPWAGQLREEQAVIRLGGLIHKELPPPDRSRELTQRALEWLNQQMLTECATSEPIVLAADVAFLLMQAHPFRDGNGRLARAIAAWVLTRAGYVMLGDPRKYCNDRAGAYFDALKAREVMDSRPSDAGPWYAFFRQVVSNCFSLPSFAPIACSANRI